MFAQVMAFVGERRKLPVVGFDKGLLHARITKNGKDRWIPLNSSLRQLLEQMRAERPKESPDKFVMRVFECQKSKDRAAKLAGVKRITHCGNHSRCD